MKISADTQNISNLYTLDSFIIYWYQRIQMNIAKNGTTLTSHDNSLRQAIAIMKGIGNSKKESGLSIHTLSKEIYQYTMAYA